MEDAELVGDTPNPCKEHVSDDAKGFALLGLLDYFFQKLPEIGFKGEGGFHEAEDEVIWEGVGALGVWWEAVAGAAVRDGSEVDGGVGWEGGLELLDVERSVYQGDFILVSFFYVESQG